MEESTTSQRPRPRKMPRQGRSTETVRAIIEATARILEQDGLGAFTTNAVAERAGVSIGSLYQYFPGKEALVGALIVRETSLLIAECEAMKCWRERSRGIARCDRVSGEPSAAPTGAGKAVGFGRGTTAVR